MEENVIIASGGLQLQGLFDPKRNDRAVVVTHPHPLYGGDMFSPVVEAVVRAYARAGWATLRFNFRGAGTSDGAFDNGRGEQDDLRRAMAFVRDKGLDNVDLAGYSFGAWVNALAYGNEPLPGRMVMVAPPVNFLDFGPVTSLSALDLVIAGDRDDFADAARVRAMVTEWNGQARMEVIPGADHFFWSDLDRVEALLFDFLSIPEARKNGSTRLSV
ncbi:MAG: alpha/beta hydrolase [Desulfobacterales bacterium]|nr:alpha/beta hydrolase [Desulfobacterales bacterium]